MASTDAKESPRIEIEIATVLLGFLFVIYSITLTIPSDVLTILTRIVYTGPLFSGNAANLFSIYGFSCALGLLTAIPFYLFYRKIGREWVLALARTFLALSMFFFVNLVLVMNALATYRLVGVQGNAYLNPISSFVMLFSLVAFPYILWLWLRLSSKFQSLWKKTQAEPKEQHEKERDSVEHQNEKPENSKVSEQLLLEKVDTRFEKKLRKIYCSKELPFFRYKARFLVLGFLLTVYFIATYLLYRILIVLPSSFTNSTPSEVLTLLVSMVAALIALATFSASIIDLTKPENEYEILVTYNYEVLKENVSDEELPLLKGLVILKSKNPEFLLSRFLSPLDKSLTNKKLFEVLYGRN